MKLEELLDGVRSFFSDKSRTQGETKAGLLAIAEECEMLADTLEDDE